MKEEIQKAIWSKTLSYKPKFIVIHEDDFNSIFIKDKTFFKVLRQNKNQVRQYVCSDVKIVRTKDIKKGTIQTAY